MRALTLIIAVIILASITAYADEKKTVDEKHSPWLNVKKDVPQVKTNIPEEYKDLVKVFDEYWTAFKSKRYDAMYRLEVADFRQKTELERYKAMKGTGSAELKVISVRPIQVKKLNEKEVIVEAALAYKVGMAESVKLFNDHWVKEKDGWMHLPSEKEVMDSKKAK